MNRWKRSRNTHISVSSIHQPHAICWWFVLVKSLLEIVIAFATWLCSNQKVCLAVILSSRWKTSVKLWIMWIIYNKNESAVNVCVNLSRISCNNTRCCIDKQKFDRCFLSMNKVPLCISFSFYTFLYLYRILVYYFILESNTW